jgi:osmotically-inducible protein OsmY
MTRAMRFGTIAAAVFCATIGLVGCEPTNSPRPRADDSALSDAAAAAVVPAQDAVMAAELVSALKIDPITRDADIQVVVARGHARLSGFVQNAAAKLRAGELAQQAQGIVAVENRLILRYRADMSANPLGDARVRL